MKLASKRLSILILFIFLIFSFTLIFIGSAEARAGGGGGGSRGGGSFRSSRSSSRRSRPLTPAERAAQAENNWRHIKTGLALIPLHLFCFYILNCRSKPSKESEQKVLDNSINMDEPLIVYIFFFITFLFFTLFYPIFLIIDTAIIGYAIRALIKFKKLVPIGYEEKYNRNLKNQNIITNIQQNIPNFDDKSFRNKITKAFCKIQLSWSKQDLAEVRNILADGTYEQFLIQIKEMKSKNIVDIMKDINVISVDYEKYEYDGNYNSVYVAIKASAINYRKNTITDYIVEGNQSFPDKFTEIWCFSKTSDSNESVKNGIIDGYCPNCATKIDDFNLDKCRSCGALLKKGPSEWMLTGIYQEYDWKETHNTYIPGIKHLLNSDPYFNIQNIEDKLSLIFWRLIEAASTNNINPILKFCSESFVKKYESKIIDSIFKYNERAGICSIEIVGVCLKKNEYCLLSKIIWLGKSKNFFSSRETQKSLFVLKRQKDSVTNLNNCFKGSHCPNCGKLDSYNNSNICEYCSLPINDNTKDWVLFDVLDYEDSAAAVYLDEAKFLEDRKVDYSKKVSSEVKTINSTKINYLKNTYSALNIDWDRISRYSENDLLRFTISIMLADGILDYREMEIIRSLNRFSERHIQNCINELEKHEKPIEYALAISDMKLDKDLLKVLILIAASDGEIKDSEYDILKKVSDKLGLSNRELIDMINQFYEIIWNKKINLQKELYLFN